jgi:hypothetical protein
MHGQRPGLELQLRDGQDVVAIVIGARRILTSVQATPEIIAAFNDEDRERWRDRPDCQRAHMELVHEIGGEHWTGTAQERAVALEALRQLAGVPHQKPRSDQAIS